jgi:iron(II)-dependent oxidoreductase
MFMARLSLLSLPRLLSAFTFRRQRRTFAGAPAPAPPPSARALLQDKFAGDLFGGDDLDRLVSDLLRQGRVALLLRPQLAASVQPRHLQQAQDVLDETTSLVPAGEVAMHSRWLETGHQETNNAGRVRVQVESMFLDRYAVTNRDFQHFVAAGGYEQMELWEAAIWPGMVEFVDQTRKPGPRYWSDQKFPRELTDHPVVGVSWYEASAYARWIGKRLPSDAEWVKAGVWPVATGGMPQQRRYPWGDNFENAYANVWGSRANTTVAVDEYPSGTSVGGVYQLTGNVWEWTSTPWGAWEPVAKRAETTVPMRSLRGGAFDTYFDNQASCQFQSGDDPLARRRNVGFRCALSWSDVSPQPVASPEPSDDIKEIA